MRFAFVLAMLAAALPVCAEPDYFLGTWKANPVTTKLSPGTADVRKNPKAFE